MILTTTHSIEGFKIAEYKGIVTGVAYESSYKHKGVKLSFKDMFNMTKHYEAYALGLDAIKEKAFQRLQENAQALNANAVVGISVDIEPVANTNALVVSITGTAVFVSE